MCRSPVGGEGWSWADPGQITSTGLGFAAGMDFTALTPRATVGHGITSSEDLLSLHSSPGTRVSNRSIEPSPPVCQ